MKLTTNASRRYRSTESRYKGGAKELYVTYDLKQKTRSGETAITPKVKRVYVSGRIKHCDVGTFAKRSGRQVHGVRIEYEQARRGGYRRRGLSATRGRTVYQIMPARVASASQTFTQVIEIPEQAHNIEIHTTKLPERYREALQDVR
jgi:hypothetical protein